MTCIATFYKLILDEANKTRNTWQNITLRKNKKTPTSGPFVSVEETIDDNSSDLYSYNNYDRLNDRFHHRLGCSDDDIYGIVRATQVVNGLRANSFNELWLIEFEPHPDLSISDITKRVNILNRSYKNIGYPISKKLVAYPHVRTQLGITLTINADHEKEARVGDIVRIEGHGEDTFGLYSIVGIDNTAMIMLNMIYYVGDEEMLNHDRDEQGHLCVDSEDAFLVLMDETRLMSEIHTQRIRVREEIQRVESLERCVQQFLKKGGQG